MVFPQAVQLLFSFIVQEEKKSDLTSKMLLTDRTSHDSLKKSG